MPFKLPSQRKAEKKIAKTKELVKDVQALSQFKRTGTVSNMAETRRVHRASKRLGVSEAAFNLSPKKRKF